VGNLTREVLENKNILDNFHSLRDKLLFYHGSQYSTTFPYRW